MRAENRTETWLAWIAVPPFLVLLFVAGLLMFMNITAQPLHPGPNEVPSVTQSSPSPKWADAVEQGRQHARAGLVEQNLPGLSVAVGAGGDIVWAEGFGWADLEKRLPVAPDMRFRIGHASIALTSAAAGLLRERGRLHLNDEIQTYVPTFEPQTQYSYSTYGWSLVSAAVETAADEPFFTFMRTQIFEPLGMADTTSDSATEPISAHVTFYYPRFSGDPSYGPELASTVDYSCFAGAGAFLSTPSDLVRFGMAVSSGTLLKPATVRVLQTPQRLASGEETGNGLGWLLETVPLAGEPTRLASHASRTLLGGSTSFLTFPERGIVVAVTTNISFAGTRSIALRIAQAFAEQGRPAGK